MSGEPGRERLVSRRRLNGRSALYATREALELDEHDSGELTRRRVFFDDLLLVTRHRGIAWAGVVLGGGLALAMLLPAAALLRSGDVGPALGVFALCSLPGLLAAVLGVALGEQVLTLHGRRNRLAISLGMRPGRAAALYAAVCRRAREAQAARRATPLAPEGAPPPTVRR